MKQLFLFILLVVGAICAQAEQYDEVKLLGLWEITEKEGNCKPLEYFQEEVLYGYGELHYISFGDTYDPSIDDPSAIGGGAYWSEMPKDFTSCGIYDPSSHEYDYVGVLFDDFFISNDNKLHIIQDMNDSEVSSFRFVIDSFTDLELKLHTYDNKMKLTLKRVATPNAVKELQGQTDILNAIYDLNGKKTQNPEKGIYVVKTGSETTKRVIR